LDSVSKVITVRLLIQGQVQGVGYRAWCLKTARGLRLAGWVRNLTDGSVEALAQGPAESIELMLAACKAGPPAARVTSVDRRHVNDPAKILEGFQQLPTVQPR